MAFASDHQGRIVPGPEWIGIGDFWGSGLVPARCGHPGVIDFDRRLLGHLRCHADLPGFPPAQSSFEHGYDERGWYKRKVNAARVGGLALGLPAERWFFVTQEIVLGGKALLVGQELKALL